jgi:hypothetical protein
VTVTDPNAALSSLADTLALDGYQLNVDVLAPPSAGAPGTVRLEVAAGEAACEECLVPQDIFAAIAGDCLGTGWTIELRYPAGHVGHS